MIATYMHCWDEHGTEYRLMPNPDADGGYETGATLMWRDGNGGDWQGHFFISPECLADMAEMLRRAAEQMEGER